MLELRRVAEALRHRAVDVGLLRGHDAFRRFVILGWYRTGSNFLRTLIDSHPRAVAYSELYSPRGVYWGTARGRPLGAARLAAARDVDPVAFLQRGPFRPQPNGIDAVGFKLFVPQLLFKEVPGLAAELVRQEVHVVRLTRRNLLRAHVSQLRSARTKRMSATARDADGAAPPVVVDVDAMLEFFAGYARRHDDAAAALQTRPLLDVVYEDLAADPAATSAAVFDFLDLPRHAAESPLVRQGGGPLDRQIENVQDVVAALRGTPWESFLSDGS